MPAPAWAGASMREPSELVSLLHCCRCFPMPSSGWAARSAGATVCGGAGVEGQEEEAGKKGSKGSKVQGSRHED